MEGPNDGVGTAPEQAGARGRTFGVAAALLLVGAGAVVGVLLARSGDGAVEPAALPSGWTRHSARGFTLGLPPGWRAVPTTTDAAAFAELERTDPQIAAVVKNEFGGGLSPFIKFLAFDVAGSGAAPFTTNMNVIILNAPDGLDAFIDTDVAQLRAAAGSATTVQTQRTQLAVGEAGIVTVQLRLSGNTALAAVTHYDVVVEEVGFILQFTTLADHLSDLAPTFEEIARSFRLA